VLGQELPVQVYLPPCYDGTRYEYPTLYLLQGSGYELGEWVDDGVTRIADLQMSLSILSPFIIVMPANDLNAGDTSKYLDTSYGKGSWEEFIVNELVPMIDQKYSTWKDREGRAIGGISRGGYWSLEIAFSNPDTFASVGGHSPAIAADYLVGVNDDFSMLGYARSIDVLKALRIFIDAGDSDETLHGMQRLAGELDAQQVSYTSSVGIGVHDDQYWSDRISDYLEFYSTIWPKEARTKSRHAGIHSDSVRSSQ
jgi:enterochelin esterase-like enzyme